MPRINELELTPAQHQRLVALRNSPGYRDRNARSPKKNVVDIRRQRILGLLAVQRSATAEAIAQGLGEDEKKVTHCLRKLKNGKLVSNLPRGRSLMDPMAKPTNKWWITPSGLAELFRSQQQNA